MQECLDAVEECGAPVVSIAGGEPLVHREIDQIVAALVKRKKFVFLCTNALLMEKKLDKFTPSPYFSWMVHIDGLRERHDELVCRDGVFDKAVSAIREAKRRGFRVSTNTTFFGQDDASTVRNVLDYLNDDLKVDIMQISPGYAYERAPDQEHFLGVERTRAIFRDAFADGRRKKWRLNHSPLFLDFLEGIVDFPCTAWAIPSYSVLGWQRPCYLMNDGYVRSYRDLLDTTEWSQYGRGRDPRCENCMAHCGYEPTAVIATTKSLRQTPARRVRDTGGAAGGVSNDEVFLTGATGFIGGHVLDALLGAGHPVRALVRRRAGCPARRITEVVGDVTRGGRPRRADAWVPGADPYAAAYSFAPAERSRIRATNVAGTAGVLEAARLAGVERAVVTSSSATVGPAAPVVRPPRRTTPTSTATPPTTTPRSPPSVPRWRPGSRRPGSSDGPGRRARLEADAHRRRAAHLPARTRARQRRRRAQHRGGGPTSPGRTWLRSSADRLAAATWWGARTSALTSCGRGSACVRTASAAPPDAARRRLARRHR